ncbi:MAG: hypothetical protein RL077_1202 [Verrucomicrobiota bacterium]
MRGKPPPSNDYGALEQSGRNFRLLVAPSRSRPGPASSESGEENFLGEQISPNHGKDFRSFSGGRYAPLAWDYGDPGDAA